MTQIEPNLFHREDWFFAKLMATIKATHTPNKRFAISDELIEFTSGRGGPVAKKLSRAERAAISKARHFACLGEFGPSLAMEAGLDVKQ